MSELPEGILSATGEIFRLVNDVRLRVDRLGLKKTKLRRRLDIAVGRINDLNKASTLASARRAASKLAGRVRRARLAARHEPRIRSDASVAVPLELEKALDLIQGLSEMLNFPWRKRLATAAALLAVVMACIAARMLPAAEQARYAEEFCAELLDMAEAGTSRWKQALYAARQVGRVPHLRAGLKAPRRNRASL